MRIGGSGMPIVHGDVMATTVFHMIFWGNVHIYRRRRSISTENVPSFFFTFLPT